MKVTGYLIKPLGWVCMYVFTHASVCVREGSIIMSPVLHVLIQRFTTIKRFLHASDIFICFQSSMQTTVEIETLSCALLLIKSKNERKRARAEKRYN